MIIELYRNNFNFLDLYIYFTTKLYHVQLTIILQNNNYCYTA